MNFETKNLIKSDLSGKVFAALLGLIFLVVAVVIIVDVPQVFAQGTSGATNGDAGGFVPCGNKATEPCQIGHLFSAFVVIINYLIAMAGFIAVIAIVFAGFMMVYSQGQDQLKAAKGRLAGAVIGLVLVAAAFIVINAIFTGSLSVGVKQGGDVLTSPLDFIKSGPSGAKNTKPPTPAPVPTTNTNTKPPTGK